MPHLMQLKKLHKDKELENQKTLLKAHIKNGDCVVVLVFSFVVFE